MSRVVDLYDATARAVILTTVSLGRPPTMTELGETLGLQATSTHRRVQLLRAGGFLRRDTDRIALSEDALILLAAAIEQQYAGQA